MAEQTYADAIGSLAEKLVNAELSDGEMVVLGHILDAADGDDVAGYAKAGERQGEGEPTKFGLPDMRFGLPDMRLRMEQIVVSRTKKGLDEIILD